MIANSMSSVPILNIDILREIAWLSDRRTCAALVSTCRFFYQEAAKCLLHYPVRLRDYFGRDVGTFVHFLGPDSRKRASYVRDLRLQGCYHVSPETVSAFQRVVSQMTGLQCLVIEDEVLCYIPSLTDTLADLTSLRRLQIIGAGERTCDFLTYLQSNIISLSVDWDDDDGNWFRSQGMGEEEWADYHPVPLLAKWSSSLEELTCEAWDTASTLPKFTEVYPRMRRLVINGANSPLVAPYIRAYPNLASLSVQLSSVLDFHLPAYEERSRHRALNICSQEAVDGPGTWQNLEEYIGSLADLYLLGLTCRIPRVVLLKYLSKRDLEPLSAVLTYAQPTHLKLEGDGALLGHPTHSLQIILREAGLSQLESLVVAIDLYRAQKELDVGAELNMLAAVLIQLPLRRLRLRVSGYGLGAPDDPWDDIEDDPNAILRHLHNPPALSSSGPCRGESTFLDLDIDVFFQELTDACPSLGDVVVELLADDNYRCRQVIPEDAGGIRGEHQTLLYEFRQERSFLDFLASMDED
ncbi:hypothetical protein OH76DRAFT_1403381 [Lentinus brumalis]|uniref:F-box domain-containing protein n=1 Tax=Lentinus brumalis TaxID=2498619 RepID=A0A371DB63_9APHY|nr:hypothetical protein OH76DRAFT_1403381 [Polyporus brumalis]